MWVGRGRGEGGVERCEWGGEGERGGELRDVGGEGRGSTRMEKKEVQGGKVPWAH